MIIIHIWQHSIIGFLFVKFDGIDNHYQHKKHYIIPIKLSFDQKLKLILSLC